MANSKINYEALSEAAQRAVRKISRIRKITLFISLAIGVMLGINVYKSTSKAGMFIFAFVLFCGMFQGAVHGIKVYKRLIRRYTIVGVFLSMIAITCYSAIGGIFLAADILLFITGKPLVFPSEFNDIISVGGSP